MKQGWLATIAGSGILLVLIVLFGVTTSQEATRIYLELAASDATNQSIEVDLGGLRSDIFLSGIYIRNQLLNTQSEWSDDQRESLREVRSSMDRRIGRIEKLIDSEQLVKIEELRREIGHYWMVVAPVMEDPVGATRNGPSVRQQLRLRRDAAIAVTEQIGNINQASNSKRHDRLRTAQASFMNYIWTMMSITVALGAMVFVGSGYLVAFLNRRAEAHRERIERTEIELRRLSSDLFQTQEQERRLLSRELHDEVGQTLTALGMELGSVERLHAGSRNEFLAHVGEAKRLTLETLKTVRKMAMGLRPAMLDDSGLGPAVRYQAREFSRHSGIPATVEISGSLDRLPDSHRTCIYRVVQEALTNCARHAHARNVRIVIVGYRTTVSVRVEDDGVGISDVTTSGLGLVGIGERTRELKGTVEITSKAHHGTSLRIELPLPSTVV